MMYFRCAIMLVALGLAGCGKSNEYAPPPPPEVTVAKPATDEVVEYLEFTGTTRAVEAIRLRARVMGYLKSIEFKDGANVEQGDLLFVIEPEPFEAALASAKANVQKAQAAFKLAEADIKRTLPLIERKAVTEAELDVKEANRATAEAEVAAAKAAERQAELNLGFTQVRAPIAGRIGRHLVDVGNLIQAEMTELATLESYDPIHAYFSVSEGDVLRLMKLYRAGEIENLRENPPPLLLGLANEEDFPHQGLLEFADLGIDPDTGTQMRRGIFANADGQLVPGLFVRLRMPVGAPESQLLISERAIAADQRGEFVLVVNDKNEVEYRPVKLGLLVQGMYVIKNGVESDDWIVVNGLQRARPGTKVSPQRTERMALSPKAPSTAAVDDH